jgi:hypothetical protein
METVWAIKAHAKLRISYFRFRNEPLKACRVEIAAIFNPKFIWISYSNLKKSLSKSVDNIFPVATTGSLDFSNFEKD